MYINKKFLDFMLTNKMHYEGKTDSTFMVKEPQGVLVVTKGRLAMQILTPSIMASLSQRIFRTISFQSTRLPRISSHTTRCT